MSKCGILQPSELILVSGLQKRQKGFREKANFNRYQFYRVFFLGDPILQAHCVHTINAIDLRFFALYCGNLEILFGTKNTNLLQEIR